MCFLAEPCCTAKTPAVGTLKFCADSSIMRASARFGRVNNFLQIFCNLPQVWLAAQVDVIVSEWMGYTLFFETMLDSVMYARDRSAHEPAMQMLF